MGHKNKRWNYKFQRGLMFQGFLRSPLINQDQGCPDLVLILLGPDVPGVFMVPRDKLEGGQEEL